MQTTSYPLEVNHASSLVMVVINVATAILTLKLTKSTSLNMLFSMKHSFQPRVCLSHKALQDHCLPSNSLVMIPSHLPTTSYMPTKLHQAPQPSPSPPFDQIHTILSDSSSTELH